MAYHGQPTQSIRDQPVSTHRNRLADETSPYLQQHADNPVDWYPWGPEALERARREDKPILLSIGYSACHWCHVMAHESFEDEETARIMNALYVNIKVDREERPDLDKIYQTAHQLLAQRPGGWPLTVFLDPQTQVPFFAGTYFPKEARHGLPAFKDLLVQVERWFRQHRDGIAEQNRRLTAALREIASPPAGARPPGPEVLEAARSQLAKAFDPRHGGFGQAPKFPHPTDLDFLLRRWGRHGDEQACHMAEFTLDRMALGGIYDQLGGGFCRYSVDALWMIPHFEKMLYDNALLLGLYAQAAAGTGKALFARTAHETAAWVRREMQSPEGGYYSALDADSEGEEGRFYVWSREAVREVLGEGLDYRLFARRFGLDRPPNFEGRWHLHVFVDVPRLAREFNLTEDEVVARIDAARTKLFAAREQRVRPGRDEKVLTAWNALMIRGMALAARHLDCPECLQSAEQALGFLRRELWRNGRLLTTYKDGRAHLAAYLDDYAFLLHALLELLELRWQTRDLEWAQALADILIEHFMDPEGGGFYFTSDEHEALIQRPKPFPDEAVPAGNGIAAQALQRLGELLGEPRYLEAAERTLAAAAASIQEAPMAHASLLIALDTYHDPVELLILRGEPGSLSDWTEALLIPYAPGRSVFAIPKDVERLPPGLAAKKPQGEVVAYRCKGPSCSPPLEELKALLDAGAPPR